MGQHPSPFLLGGLATGIFSCGLLLKPEHLRFQRWGLQTLLSTGSQDGGLSIRGASWPSRLTKLRFTPMAPIS
jgi:hypothetical protein